jgi:predicted nucleic-acid-binding protein
MIGLDTNVLVRYLVEDDDPQKRAADRFVEEALNRGESLSMTRKEAELVQKSLPPESKPRTCFCI